MVESMGACLKDTFAVFSMWQIFRNMFQTTQVQCYAKMSGVDDKNIGQYAGCCKILFVSTAHS
jgi:hypothetical protein